MTAVKPVQNRGNYVRGKYELLEVTGRGGMAVVWRAIQRGDLGFERVVAIKQMHPHLAERPLYVDMFAEEARVGSMLRSSHVPQVYDFVADGENYYLVMEWIDGLDLGGFIRYHRERGRPVRWEHAAAIGIGVLRALSAAHQRTTASGDPMPVVHRDVSPHNILITPEGVVKLVDFGLSLADDRNGELTEPGVVKGKMSYLSPEVASGERPTPAADLFATGSVLWETLVGRKLFDGPNDFDIYKKVRDGQIQPLRPLRRDLPRSLVALIQRALALRPEDRFATAREMAQALSGALKSGRAPQDLHHLLGEATGVARRALEAETARVQTETPLTEVDELSSPSPFQMRPGTEPNRPSRRDARQRPLGPGTDEVDPGAVEAEAREEVEPAEVEVDSPEAEPRKRGLLHRLPLLWRRARRG